MPIVEIDEIVARLAPHLIAEPKNPEEEEINFLLDYAMEQGWDLHYHEPGILYHTENPGHGNRPKWGDYVSVHYEGRSLDNKVFDSSRYKGIAMQFYVGNVIAGWNEILQNRLRPHGRGLYVIPSHLAYGKDGFGKYVAPGEHLIFDIELTEILADPGEINSRKKQ